MPVRSAPRSRRLAALLVATVAIASIASPAAAVGGEQYVALASQKRASVGLPAVGLAAIADQISVERANAIAASDDFSHDMAYVKARLDASGTCYTGYGEIIAWEQGYPTYDPARTMEQWWASPTHHAIIVGDYNGAGGSYATSPNTGRLYAVMIFVKLCSAPAPQPAPGGNDTTFSRLAGGDRYATAAALSQARFGSGASTVFIATGGSFPDALAGSPAAAAANGPILLTARDGLPGPTANELSRLRPSRIVILGGPGVVSDAVAGQLAGYARSVERWWGANRFETAAAISRATFAPGVGVAYLATGSSFPDALSGGAVAGRNGGPILLVTGDAIPASTANELARLRPQQIVVLGGTGVIAESVRAAAAGYATSGTASRLAGADRFATSVAISQSAYGAGGSDAAFVATGRNFPDGLAGGPVAALVPGPILLVTPTQLPGSVSAELQRLAPDTVYVIGGTGAVSNGVVNAMDAVLP